MPKKYGYELVDSKYPEKNLSARIQKWILSSLQTEKYPEPQSEHIDDLLDHPLRPKDTFPVACQAYRTLIEEMGKLSYYYMPMLIVSLNVSKNLKTNLPYQEVKDFHFSSTTPSLYLINRDVQKHVWPRELYQCPMTFEELKRQNDVFVSYNSFRTMQDIENDDVYQRFIQAEFHPPPFR